MSFGSDLVVSRVAVTAIMSLTDWALADMDGPGSPLESPGTSFHYIASLFVDHFGLLRLS
jgi:hypothetical protein